MEIVRDAIGVSLSRQTVETLFMELENHMSQSMHCQLDEATSANGLGQKVLMALDRKASIHLSSILVESSRGSKALPFPCTVAEISRAQELRGNSSRCRIRIEMRRNNY